MEWTEQEYLAHLAGERRRYAWVMRHHGGRTAVRAGVEATEWYPYEPADAPHRGLTFHDSSWHWAMSALHGADCHRIHPELSNPSAEYDALDRPGRGLLAGTPGKGHRATGRRVGATARRRGGHRRGPAAGTGRGGPVPIPPVLVGMLREHIKTYGTADDGRLFRADPGSRVRSTEYCEVRDRARVKALSEAEAATPLADVPYSLRHAGVSLWINSGVDPVEVARQAGHNLTVLFRS